MKGYCVSELKVFIFLYEDFGHVYRFGPFWPLESFVLPCTLDRGYKYLNDKAVKVSPVLVSSYLEDFTPSSVFFCLFLLNLNKNFYEELQAFS